MEPKFERQVRQGFKAPIFLAEPESLIQANQFLASIREYIQVAARLATVGLSHFPSKYRRQSYWDS